MGLLAVTALAGSAHAAAQTTNPHPPRVVSPPPPVYIPPPPIDTAAPGKTSLEEQIARWGAAPAQAATPAILLDKKEAKALRRKRNQDREQCLNSEKLRVWMATPKLEACDRVLAMAADASEGWDMRARLLQGRAVSLLSLDGDRLAMAALDESDAIGEAAHDSLFDLGVGLGNDMLRAYAMNRLGRADEAREILGRIRAARPYAASVVASADLIEVAAIDRTAMRARLAERIAIDPDALRIIFLVDLLDGRLPEADAVGEQISLTEPKMRGGWKMIGGLDPVQQVEREMIFQGLRAYVAAALGDMARADQLSKDTRTLVSDYIGEDPRNEQQRRISNIRVKEYLARVESSKGMLTIATGFDTIIGLRREVAGLTPKQLAERVTPLSSPGMLPALVEMLRQIRGPEQAEATATADLITREVVGNIMTLEAGDLGMLLPKAEALDDIPKFASAASKWLFSDGSGWSQAKEGDGSIRTVRYETLVGSRAMMEEMALLAAAQLAREEGKDGFVILSNRTFARQTTTTGWGGSSTYSSGFESQARIQLVDSANLPAPFTDQTARIITVSQIERDLQPRYDRYMAAKEALRQAKKARD